MTSPDHPDSAGARRRRAGLTREAIIATAVEFLEERGLAALTMRELGDRLGVEAMSLYHYVNGREDLLEGIVDLLADQVRVDPNDPIGPANGWQGYLQVLATSVRAVAVDHPNAFPLLATRHPAAPWLRPPLRSLRVVEEFLEAMLSRGLDEEQAVWMYKAFSGFLLGHLLLEVSSQAPVSDAGIPEQDDPEREQQLDLADCPRLLELRPQLARHDPDAEFERALEALLDRLERDLHE